MAKTKFIRKNGDFKKAIEMLKRIKELQGDRKIISVSIKSNGKENNENPAFYGAIHEAGAGYDSVTGRYYKFLSPALRGFYDKFRDDYRDAIIRATKLKSSGKRRTQKELLDNAEVYARSGVDRVQEYILYEAPQYPDRKRKNPSLIETGELFDSIQYTIRNENCKILRSGQ